MSATIVLCAGPLNLMNLPIGTNVSNAMVPVNGKPVIAWILDDLLAKGIDSVTVVIRKENERLGLFLRRAFASRSNLIIAEIDQESTILESLDLGLRSSESDGTVRVLLGDTLILDRFDHEGDFVYVGDVHESRRWCAVHLDQDDHIVSFMDKQELPGHRHLALAGYYQFLDGSYLRECVADAKTHHGSELSHVLTAYARKYPLRARHADQWHDFGHVDNFNRAKRSLLRPRFFNSLEIDPALNTITKLSANNEKLQDELSWYLTIPEELKVLTPRIVSQRQVNGSLEIVQEYYGYPTLAELFVFGDLPADAWISILRRVLDIHERFRRHHADVTPEDVIDMYLLKTLRRLQIMADSSPEWRALLARPAVAFNGQPLRNLPVLMKDIEAQARALADSRIASVIHGDLCFSNILFDFTNQIIRLIDPRGRFGRRGIHGDARYDIAKLRHSVRGLYDFILADMFTIQVNDGSAHASVFADQVPEAAGVGFDELLSEAGYDVRTIQLIEGLLFLSMLPLHQGHPRRQQMMYFTGLRLLNQVL